MNSHLKVCPVSDQHACAMHRGVVGGTCPLQEPNNVRTLGGDRYR